MKKLLALFVIVFVASAQALDMKGKGSRKAGLATDVALKELTKKLKNVQNEKGPIVFKTGSAEIDVEKSKKTLKAVDEIICNYPGFLVQVEGHTDNVGNAQKNVDLSQKRADAVKNYLIKTLNTPAKRLKSKGFGDTKPIADNKTDKGRAKNRRVDFSVFKM
ncbi:MAG TPA: OmpA family protein [Spirochaetota bacterium]|nr:OmpA family protein [Spirochaetota bacterium]HPI89856.1 OmpA family protein [Spirochaetota bacterium]HPR48631.1 OmpA family protein [Spirochaetota bacterium]